jgi:hypothetical protein
MKCFVENYLRITRFIFSLCVFLGMAGVSECVGQFKIGSVLETEKRQVFDLMTKHYKTLSSVKGLRKSYTTDGRSSMLHPINGAESSNMQ